MVMIGGIMRLVVVTGGVRALVQLLSNRTQLVKNRVTTQLLAILITSLIFIESSINQLVAGASTKNLARKYAVAPEKCLISSKPLVFLFALPRLSTVGVSDYGVNWRPDLTRAYHW